MEPNTVRIDRSGAAPVFIFADSFNVAVHMIDRHIDEGRSGKAAFITERETIDYGQLAERVNRCGNALLDAGIPVGGRVLMIVKDCPEFVYLYYGAIKAGIVPVPINTLLRAADYQYMIDDSDCAALIYSPEFEDEVRPALEGATHKVPFVALTGGDGGLGDMIADASDGLDPHPSDAMADCFWLYSSGSTGRPKGTVHRQRDLLVSAVLYSESVLQITEDDIMFSAAKLFFAYGLANSMNFPLMYGASAVLSDERPTPEMTFRIIAKHRPTIYFGVPTLYAAQCRALETEKPDLSSLRACVSAGEALPASIFERWKEVVGVPPVDGIGSTEGTHIFISNHPDNAKAGTSGRIVPGYDARIVDDDGNDVTPGEVGRLLVKGQSMAAYYWNRPERTAQT
ncbi:unnamed protein product, partial [Laminaria digitata]